LPLREHGVEGGRAGPGRGKKTNDRVSRFQYGNSTDYLASRIKRDAPEIAARIDEFPNIKAAARAAGIIKSEKPLTIIRRAWKNASTKEREQIIAWINQQGQAARRAAAEKAMAQASAIGQGTRTDLMAVRAGTKRYRPPVCRHSSW
jgi:hypothetical protein